MSRAASSLVLVCCLGIMAALLVACSAAQDKTQAKLAAVSAGCAVELSEADAGADLAAMRAGCTTALRLLDPIQPDGGK